MPRHRIEVKQPAVKVLNADISFTIYSDGQALGELRISKGSVDWRPSGHSKHSRWSWEAFARRMDKNAGD
jgi:hypothetical protein